MFSAFTFAINLFTGPIGDCSSGGTPC